MKAIQRKLFTRIRADFKAGNDLHFTDSARL
jgi:hypothetical protein